MTDQPRTLGGRYQLGKVIGRGGMAQVRQATDMRLGREVAIKELRVDLASDSTFQARFRREAQAAAGLNHPNIVSVYDTGEELDPGTGIAIPYIVMELVNGRTLRDVLREGRPILPQRALEFTQGVLDALSYSHKAGIVHRDIKPANVMLTNSGLVKVMDFGIARAVADTSSTMTQTAAVIGTAQYLSPEQARGETVDARSDIYSAGCLLYELLVGRPPFQGESPVSVAYQHVREAPVSPSQLDAEVTPAMDAVVLKALAKDPQDRYQTATAMRDDIARLLAGHPVAAVLPPPLPAPIPESAAAATVAMPAATGAGPRRAAPAPTPVNALPEERRRARWPWIALIGVLLVALGVGGYLLATSGEKPAAQVTVPPLYGLQQAVAEKAIRDANLQPVVEAVAGANDSTVGTVTSQNPIPGAKVETGATVKITLNVGPKRLTIPTGLIGKSKDEAIKALNTNGFLNARAQEATDEPADAKANTVLSVTPNEGTSVTADAEIVIKFAVGKARIPDVRNQPQADALSALANAGFSNVKVKPQTSTQAAGTVITTSPPYNTLVVKSDPITVYVAAAPPPATNSSTPAPSSSVTPAQTP